MAMLHSCPWPADCQHSTSPRRVYQHPGSMTPHLSRYYRLETIIYIQISQHLVVPKSLMLGQVRMNFFLKYLGTPVVHKSRRTGCRSLACNRNIQFKERNTEYFSFMSEYLMMMLLLIIFCFTHRTQEIPIEEEHSENLLRKIYYWGNFSRVQSHSVSLYACLHVEPS